MPEMDTLEFAQNSTMGDWNETGYGHNMSNFIVIPEGGLIDTLYFFVFPVFIIIGLIGNCLTCYVVNKPPLNAFSISFYTFAYTISNILTLFLNYGVQWLHDTVGQKHFKMNSDSGCRIWEFFFRLITYSGIWFVVAMGIDRYIALWHPLKAPDMCTVFMAKISVVIIMTAMLVLSVHAMWTYEVANGWCLITRNDFQLLWQWVSGMSYSAVPLTLMFILGNLLIVRLCLKHRGRQLPECVETEMDLTVTVVVLCYVYFLSITPATVINIIDSVHPPARASLETIRTITQLLWWINHTCLFFLAWFTCSKAFRKTLKKTLVRCKMCLTRRGPHVELKMLSEETEETQADSTTV